MPPEQDLQEVLLQCEQLSNVESRKIVSKKFSNDEYLDRLEKKLEKINKISCSLLSIRLDHGSHIQNELFTLIRVITLYKEDLNSMSAQCVAVESSANILLSKLNDIERSIKYSKLLMNIKVIFILF